MRYGLNERVMVRISQLVARGSRPAALAAHSLGIMRGQVPTVMSQQYRETEEAYHETRRQIMLLDLIEAEEKHTAARQPAGTTTRPR